MEIIKFILASVISAVGLIVLAKIVLQKIIRRPSDYYQKEEDKQEEIMLSKVDIDDGSK